MLVRREVEQDVLVLFEQAARNAQHGAKLLHDLLRDFPERLDLAEALKACEHEGDRLTHDIILELRLSTAKLPLDAADGHALATALDDVVDFAEQTADWLILYAVEAPVEPATEMSSVLCDATSEVVRAISALRAGDDVAAPLAEINRLEDDCDRLYREGVASLFVSGIDPMVVIRWKDIFQSVEQAVDACETVAHVVEGITLKRAR